MLYSALALYSKEKKEKKKASASQMEDGVLPNGRDMSWWSYIVEVTSWYVAILGYYVRKLRTTIFAPACLFLR